MSPRLVDDGTVDSAPDTVRAVVRYGFAGFFPPDTGEVRYKGDNIADAIRTTGMFPPVVYHLIATGQMSGNIEDGLIDVTERVRTRSKAIDRIIEITAARVGTSAPVNLAVVHAEAPDEGLALLERARSRFRCQESFLCSLTTSLVVHFGPGVLGLIAYSQ